MGIVGLGESRRDPVREQALKPAMRIKAHSHDGLAVLFNLVSGKGDLRRVRFGGEERGF